ncbi:MAG: hypothetical protein B7Z37_16865 [Verrucomicrobia bacterium 12-59-8]|nr:MAG: hypothetical protein B7Z37_16865 [Verrucomicrobia bacterium 12-59-8]
MGLDLEWQAKMFSACEKSYARILSLCGSSLFSLQSRLQPFRAGGFFIHPLCIMQTLAFAFIPRFDADAS